MRVAESMVILRPMFQVGWCSASSRVIASNVSRRPVAEGAAGGGEHEPLDLGRARGRPGTGAARSARCRWAGCGAPRACASRGHELARHDQGLLVGEGHVLARLEGAVGGHEAQRAHGGRHHEARLVVGGHRDHPLFAHSHADPREVDEPGERLARLRVGHGHDPRAVPRHLRRQGLDVAAAGEPDDPEALRKESTTRSTFVPTEPVQPRMESPFISGRKAAATGGFD